MFGLRSPAGGRGWRDGLRLSFRFHPCERSRRGRPVGWWDQHVEPVVIPATMGLDRGVWYRIRPGSRGLVIGDEHGFPRVYVICEPASHYYQIMTRGSRWMPCLIDERI